MHIHYSLFGKGLHRMTALHFDNYQRMLTWLNSLGIIEGYFKYLTNSQRLHCFFYLLKFITCLSLALQILFGVQKTLLAVLLLKVI